MLIKRLMFFLLSTVVTSQMFATNRIVILGSSTASGVGPKEYNNIWVMRYKKYLESVNQFNDVINLAVPGYTTYNIMPSDFVPPKGRENFKPDTLRNISKALSLKPQAIIINMPTNDVFYNISTNDQMSNYIELVKFAAKANIPVWITTSQPRNYNTAGRDSLIMMKYKILSTFRDKAIDFWSTLANEDGTVNPIFSVGDGIHLNDSAHAIFCQRVVLASIPQIISGKVKGLVLDENELTLTKLQMHSLNAIVLTSDTVDNHITWKSNDDKIISVTQNGLIRSLNVGTTNVTVSTADGLFSANCSITVNDTASDKGLIYVYATAERQINVMGLKLNDKISLYSLSGIIVKSDSPVSLNTTIDISDLSKGVYILKIVRSNIVISRKIVCF